MKTNGDLAIIASIVALGGGAIAGVWAFPQTSSIPQDAFRTMIAALPRPPLFLPVMPAVPQRLARLPHPAAVRR